MQQALLQAGMALQQGVVRDAKSWFYRIVHNTALNMQRGPAMREVAPLLEDQRAHGAGDIEGWMEIKDGVRGSRRAPAPSAPGAAANLVRR